STAQTQTVLYTHTRYRRNEDGLLEVRTGKGRVNTCSPPPENALQAFAILLYRSQHVSPVPCSVHRAGARSHSLLTSHYQVPQTGSGQDKRPFRRTSSITLDSFHRTRTRARARMRIRKQGGTAFGVYNCRTGALSPNVLENPSTPMPLPGRFQSHTMRRKEFIKHASIEYYPIPHSRSDPKFQRVVVIRASPARVHILGTSYSALVIIVILYIHVLKFH
ncbi:hypothetical protein CVT26_011687, partial [Gymnopilus dilepis]